MMPSSFGAKGLMEIPDVRRADIMNRHGQHEKDVGRGRADHPKPRHVAMLAEIDAERAIPAVQPRLPELMNGYGEAAD